MKTILIIYVVSWLIMLLIWLINRMRNAPDEKESLSTEIIYWSFMILLAPFVLVYSAYSSISDFLYKRKHKDEIEERKRAYEERERKRIQKREEEENYKRQSIADLDKAIAGNPDTGFSLEYAETAHALMGRATEEDYEHIMAALKDISIPEGGKLIVEKYKASGTGDVCKLYIETPQGKKDYEIWNHIKVEYTEKSVWDAYLLYSLWHSLPLFWHSNYCQRTYTYDVEDTENIECLMRDNYNQTARANARTPVRSAASHQGGGQIFREVLLLVELRRLHARDGGGGCARRESSVQGDRTRDAV